MHTAEKQDDQSCLHSIGTHVGHLVAKAGHHHIGHAKGGHGLHGHVELRCAASGVPLRRGPGDLDGLDRVAVVRDDPGGLLQVDHCVEGQGLGKRHRDASVLLPNVQKKDT